MLLKHGERAEKIASLYALIEKTDRTPRHKTNKQTQVPLIACIPMIFMQMWDYSSHPSHPAPVYACRRRRVWCTQINKQSNKRQRNRAGSNNSRGGMRPYESFVKRARCISCTQPNSWRMQANDFVTSHSSLNTASSATTQWHRDEPFPNKWCSWACRFFCLPRSLLPITRPSSWRYCVNFEQQFSSQKPISHQKVSSINQSKRFGVAVCALIELINRILHGLATVSCEGCCTAKHPSGGVAWVMRPGNNVLLAFSDALRAHFTSLTRFCCRR